MTKEHPQQPIRRRPADEFGLTQVEQTADRVSHERLLQLLGDEETTVRRLDESYNNYGSFLFLTVTRPGADRPIWMTFYGAGFDEQRERWITKEWFFYMSNPFPAKLQQDMSKEEALGQITARLKSIGPEATQAAQSQRGRLFELIAELTDEDAAYIEMQDLDDLGSSLDEM